MTNQQVLVAAVMAALIVSCSRTFDRVAAEELCATLRSDFAEHEQKLGLGRENALLTFDSAEGYTFVACSTQAKDDAETYVMRGLIHHKREGRPIVWANLARIRSSKVEILTGKLDPSVMLDAIERKEAQPAGIGEAAWAARLTKNGWTEEARTAKTESQ